MGDELSRCLQLTDCSYYCPSCDSFDLTFTKGIPGRMPNHGVGYNLAQTTRIAYCVKALVTHLVGKNQQLGRKDASNESQMALPA